MGSDDRRPAWPWLAPGVLALGLEAYAVKTDRLQPLTTIVKRFKHQGLNGWGDDLLYALGGWAFYHFFIEP